MRTTVDIDKELLQEAMKLSSAKTQRRAITLALEELVRSKRLERLAARIGRFEISLTKEELDRMRRGE